MKFIPTADDFDPDSIPFLKGLCTRITEPDGTELYEAPAELGDKLKVLEEAGFIRIIKAQDISQISSYEDIIELTERVELLQGGTAHLRAVVAGHIFEFTESQLLSPNTLMKRLIRLKKFIRIKPKEWEYIITDWLSRAVEVQEISEEDEIREAILNYLTRCTIYTEKEKAISMYTLFYDPNEPDVVYCLSENLKHVTDEESLRKIRWIMSDYIVDKSVQKRIHGEKKRFWKFYIDKCDIDISTQLHTDEDRTILEIEENDGGDEDGENSSINQESERSSRDREDDLDEERFVEQT